MKKYIHLGFCCLLSSTLLSAYAPTAIRSDAPSMDPVASRDAKTSRILASVGRVVEGLIKVIKDPHNKQSTLLHVGDMLSGIFDIAANSLPHHELNVEEVKELRDLMRDVARSVEPLLRQYLTENARSMRNYLQAIPLKELELIIKRSDDHAGAPEAIPTGDENEQELHNNVLHALHELIQDLFAIVQHPENPELVGQSIADMLASIMNVASQTLKYEFLTSRDAEENVALYLESFSNELTKELKHLMLQTALHLRGEMIDRKGCCSTSCNTSCKPCKPACNTSCKPSCNTSCKPACNTGCHRSEMTDEEADEPASDDMAERSCKPCNKPCNTTNNCKPACNTGCHKSEMSNDANDDASAPDEMGERSCKPCNKPCNTTNNCKPACNTGCHKSEMSNDANDDASAPDEMGERSCKPCNKPCNTSCKPACNTGCHKSEMSDDADDDASAPDEMGERSCKPCNKPCNTSCKPACNTGCHKSEMSDDADDDASAPDEMAERSCKPCNKPCNTNCKPACNTSCHKSEMSNDEPAPVKDRRMRPSRKQVKMALAQAKEDTAKGCGCNKPKPKTEENKAAKKPTLAQIRETKTCCGNQIQTRPPRPSQRVHYPEQFIVRNK